MTPSNEAPFRLLDNALRAPQRDDADPALPGAAVAMVFRPGPGGPELLMIRRADKKGDPWSGQMAFPGGKAEPEDADPVATAARETMEEVGLDLSPARLLGPLAPINARARLLHAPLVVRPFVFGLGLPTPPLTPNVEVARTHWFALERLLAREGRARFPFTWRGQPVQMPCVDLDGCRIWGMSLRMIDDLLARIRAIP